MQLSSRLVQCQVRSVHMFINFRLLTVCLWLPNAATRHLSCDVRSCTATCPQVTYFWRKTWGVHVLRSPNFFLGEWKQIETWKLLEETWLFFGLGEAKWQHCTTRSMLVTRSSCSSVFDIQMATFTFEEQRVIIRFLHLRGMKPIEIHRQLSETCSDGVMDVKNVRSWVRQFKEGRTSCDVVRSSSKVS